jgi:hypothetical protein
MITIVVSIKICNTKLWLTLAKDNYPTINFFQPYIIHYVAYYFLCQSMNDSKHNIQQKAKYIFCSKKNKEATKVFSWLNNLCSIHMFIGKR